IRSPAVLRFLNGALCQVISFFSRSQSLYVKCNGRLAHDDDVLQNGAVYSLEPRLCGGKGGFGSMLRALGAQIEKTTNREACRDLSGRRLRDVNHEKAMAEWVKQQAEREAEKEQRRLERLQRKLAEPKHYFINPDYQQQCHEMAERLEDSVLKGIAINTCTACCRLGLEGLDDTDSSDSDDSENDSPHASDGSCPSGSGYGENAGSSNKCSNSPVDPAEHSPVTEKAPEQPEVSGSDLQREMHKGGQTEIPADENSKVTEPQKEEAQENNEVTQGVKEEVQENVSSKVQEVDQSQSTVSMKQYRTRCVSFLQLLLLDHFFSVEPIDLLAFNSAAEMEVLGLDKLKMELMALGLKCGGTLQERAARLFSVRGLTRDQINPSLFAKPPKGKKK
uniref:Replication stress response regulator SDE2 n=1 Tax=Anser cygnoides TaxID=8845 RepID=A0A8B9DDR0_ANSCY